MTCRWWDREPSPVPSRTQRKKSTSSIYHVMLRVGQGTVPRPTKKTANESHHREHRGRFLAMGQGTVPCPILSMCRNVDFIQGAGKIIPRALAVGLIEVFILGQGTVPCPTRVSPLACRSRMISAHPCSRYSSRTANTSSILSRLLPFSRKAHLQFFKLLG